MLKHGRSAVDPRAVLRRLRDQLRAQAGFTLIEVMVATMVLIVGLLALLGMVIVANKATQTNRVRQEATNVAREVIENVRALSYTQLATPASIASALLPQLTCPAGAGSSCGATLSGSTLKVWRSSSVGGGGAGGYAFNVTFTTCSMDDPSDGYGNHSAPPASGGSWCPDVAPSGTTDPNPDDYKRVSAIVTPTGNGGAATVYPVQQTVDIYAKPVNGPAVSCLTIVSGPCPGQNQSMTTLGITSMTFNVTTTNLAQKIQWLVNGNTPGTQDPTGANGTYTPGGLTSSFTWDIPTATVGGTLYTIDGTYSISAIAYDANGNSGTRSTLQVSVNEHPVLAPATIVAGFDGKINSGTLGVQGGVDIQWVPSVDQDVLYYNVYHQVTAGGVRTTTQACSDVTGTSCTDTSPLTIGAAPIWPTATVCGNPRQSYTTTNLYWVVGVDRYPDGTLRDPNTNTPGATAFQTPPEDANVCDHPPNPPSNLGYALSGGSLNLSWAAPAAPVDPDTADGDTISSWRLYRWPATQGATPPLTVANRLQLIGAGGSPFVTTATDQSPDPGGAPQDYCVTSVDEQLNESACSNVITQ